MHTRVFRISVLAVTIALLAVPFIASAQQSDQQLIRAPLFQFAGDDSSVRSEQTARYQIYVDAEMDLAKEIRFIEINGWSYDSSFTIEFIFASQAAPSHAYDRDFPLPAERRVGTTNRPSGRYLVGD